MIGTRAHADALIRKPSRLAPKVMSAVGAGLSLCLVGGTTSLCIGIYLRLLSRAQGTPTGPDFRLYLMLGVVLPLVAVIVGYLALMLLAVPQPARTLVTANGFVAIASVPVAFILLVALVLRVPIPFMPVYVITIACLGAIIWALVVVKSIDRG